MTEYIILNEDLRIDNIFYYTLYHVNTYISIFSPTLAQVQIEIMKAVTKKLTTPSESAFVQGFISRPDMRSLSINLEESYCTGTGCNCMFLDCFALR